MGLCCISKTLKLTVCSNGLVSESRYKAEMITTDLSTILSFAQPNISRAMCSFKRTQLNSISLRNLFFSYFQSQYINDHIGQKGDAIVQAPHSLGKNVRSRRISGNIQQYTGEIILYSGRDECLHNAVAVLFLKK